MIIQELAAEDDDLGNGSASGLQSPAIKDSIS